MNKQALLCKGAFKCVECQNIGEEMIEWKWTVVF